MFPRKLVNKGLVVKRSAKHSQNISFGKNSVGVMKRLGMCAMFLLASGVGGTLANAQPGEPARVIHVVYDDSGSMIADPETKYKTYVDTWCQAKYAMEVLAAMLGENDKLNVYYMSSYDLVKKQDFSNCKAKIKPTASGVLSLKGSLNAGIIQQNVNTVQENTTVDGDTPFCPVVDAYQDLILNTGTAKDNKWLVVLTDGQFEDSTSEITQKYYNDFSKNVNVVVLSIGKLVDTTIAPDEANGLFIRHAQTSQDVLNELTQIGNRIFQRNTIPIAADNTFSLQIPMKQIIVFAQGQGVDVASLTNSQKQKSNRPVTSVRATQPAVTHATLRKRDLSKINAIVQGTNGKLNGQLVAFKGFQDKRYFAPDSYHIDFAGEESHNVQLYYDPFVGVGIHVTDTQGQAVDPKTMQPGKYHVDLNFENPDSHELIERELLRNPKNGEDAVIHGTITITGINPENGEEIQISKSDFDMSTDFDLQPGQRARIDYSGKYLEYNTVSSEGNSAFMLPFQLPKPKLSLVPNAEGNGQNQAGYGITGSGFHEDGKPLHFALEAKDYYDKPVEISDSDWNKLNLKVEPAEIASIVKSLEIKKNPDRSFDIIPHFVDNGFADIVSQKAELTIIPEIQSDTLDIEGSFKGLLDFHNDIEKDEFVWKALTAPNYCIVCEGIALKDEPIRVSASFKEREMTDDIWNALQPPSLMLMQENKMVSGFEDCQKTEEKGVFKCMPVWSENALNKPFDNEKGTVQYAIQGTTVKLDTLIAKSPEPQKQEFSIGSDISASCWILHYLTRLLAALAGLIIILGEVLKPRLPKIKDISMKSRYNGEDFDDDRIKPRKYTSALSKTPGWTLFSAQTGELPIRIDNNKTIPFELKATGRGRDRKMAVTNISSLQKMIGDDIHSISIGSTRIDENLKRGDKPIALSTIKGAIKIQTAEKEYRVDIQKK